MSVEPLKNIQMYPHVVRCVPQKDGGAVVTAHVNYQQVAARAFDCAEVARAWAATLHGMKFEVLPEDCEAIDF